MKISHLYKAEIINIMSDSQEYISEEDIKGLAIVFKSTGIS